jgi:hypothetical protein
MDLYEAWSENRTKVPPGNYELKCVKAEKKGVWHEGQNAWGKSEKVVLWFEVLGGDFSKAILPMFLTIGEGGKVHQGSKYFISWCIANGLQRPSRSRLKEMPVSKFENKVFQCAVVDVKPKWKNGREAPALFHYSRVDAIYDLLVGNPLS